MENSITERRRPERSRNRSLQSYSFIGSSPQPLLLASKGRRIHALNPPQPTLCLIDVELLVVTFVCNIWLQNKIDSGRDSMICFVRIGLRDRDVVDDDSDERIFGRPPM